MALYSYVASRYTGEKKRGKIRAGTQQEVRTFLKEKNLKVLSIEEQMETLANKEVALFSKVSLKLLVSYLQQFSTLSTAGINVLHASEMLEEQINDKRFKGILKQISIDLKEGKSLSECYGKHPNAFPNLLVSMIQAAEISGTLESTLSKLSDYYEKTAKSRSSVITAMMYPIFMFIAAIGVGVFLCVSIVPMFVTVFEGFGSDLPQITKIVLAMSNFLKHKGIFLSIFIILLVITFLILKRNDKFKLAYDTLLLKLPLFGEFIQKGTLTTFLTTLSSLLENSVSMTQALQISREVVENSCIKNIIKDCELEVESGGKLSNIFSVNPVIPFQVTQMTRIGEEAGNLEEMLDKISRVYQAEVEQMSERIKTISEPLVIIVIAVIVGFIVAAIMIPMFDMYDSLQA